MIPQIERKISDGIRLAPSEGLFLLTSAPLLWMGSLAAELKDKKGGLGQVTFVVDSNPNYTNICDTDCQFALFIGGLGMTMRIPCRLNR
jgi:cyclic dehypoxanthinyl futalosine synthase